MMKGKKSQKVTSSAFHFHFEQFYIIRKEILICDTKMIKMNKIENKLLRFGNLFLFSKIVQTGQFWYYFYA